MARAFGIYVNPPLARSGELEAAVDFQPYRAPDVTTLVDTWLPLSNALNSLNRTMGQPDLYPFILSPTVIKKLGAIHDLVHGDVYRRSSPRRSLRLSQSRPGNRSSSKRYRKSCGRQLSLRADGAVNCIRFFQPKGSFGGNLRPLAAFALMAG